MARPRKFVYLVAYIHSEGIARDFLYLDSKIVSQEEVEQAEAYLEKQRGKEQVGMISYQLISSRLLTPQELKDRSLQSIAKVEK